MVLRTRSVLLVLLLLLVIGASAQAATCEVRCGLGTAASMCHQTMAMDSHSNQANGVGTSHCKGATGRAEDKMAMPQTGRCVVNTCLMPSSNAVVEKSQTDGNPIILPSQEATVAASGAFLEGHLGLAPGVPVGPSNSLIPLARQLRV